MPVSHGVETLKTASPNIQLELKENTVSILMDGKAIAAVNVGHNDYQRLLSYVQQSQ
jgi:hypothetical protein